MILEHNYDIGENHYISWFFNDNADPMIALRTTKHAQSMDEEDGMGYPPVLYFNKQDLEIFINGSIYKDDRKYAIEVLNSYLA